MREYDHKKIEKKWQEIWEKKGIYHAKDLSSKPKYYSLIEFPYPSGDGLHVGHPRPYIGMDVISRTRRLQGFNVLYPIGWDAFGLPTENYAIKTGLDPRVVTKKNSDTFRRQIKSLGISFDWSREINTTDPKYYKWTQWIFLQFLKKGLAYKAKMTINWCPKDKIGLANEEVVNGCCERCGTVVEQREKEQWMLAITKYADRLYKDLDEVDYLPQIKLGQRNWIWRSEGAEIQFKIIHPSPTLPQEKGEIPGYHTTDPKNFRLLQEKAVEMRENPTEAERKLWQELKGNKNNFHFRQQHIINKFIVDFVCLSKNLIIEIDGDMHDLQKEKDAERSDIFKILGFEVIRFRNEEVLENIDSVVKRIIKKLDSLNEAKVLPLGEDLGGVFDSTHPLTPSQREGEFDGNITVFTTRPDTIFGATYLVLSPEHSLVEKITTSEQMSYVINYVTKSKNKNKQERVNLEKEKTGVFTGAYAINPSNKEKIPVWIADYVLSTYGTRAIMGVPAHDERDFEFAKKYKLPIKQVITGADLLEGESKDFYEGGGVLSNSGKFDGMDSEKAKKEIIKFIGGKEKVTFKLRDWVFSRQRYWGEPIPVIHCEKCGMVPVPEKDLPVELPKVKNYQPTDSGESPLVNITKWVNVKCPICGGKAKRETDTMPNWAGSSWYYLRYADPKNKKEFAGKKNLKYWLTPPPSPLQRKGKSKVLPFGEDIGGVDWYNGGNEHTTLHLLYSRFWHKFLYDLKLVPTNEPYMKRTSHGMILGEGGVKMSKSLGNVINPDDIVKTYGADTLRIYEMFMGPFDQSVVWSTESIIGARRFIEKVWRIGNKVNLPPTPFPRKGGRITKVLPLGKDLGEVKKLLHKTIKKVSEDIEAMRFNTAVSTLMILANEMDRSEVSLADYKKFLQLLAPFAPHITEELWSLITSPQLSPKGREKLKSPPLGEVGGGSIHLSTWPKWDANLIKDEEVKIAVQLNGKVRAEILAQADATEEDIKKKAFLNESVAKYIAGKEIRKVIYIKNRLMNIVV